ncbi:MAG: SprT family zinc-dependent metalloprotease [Candidatus Omnitrophota bacterium]
MEEPFIHEIIRSKRRTVGLQVTQDARLIVRVPPRMPVETVHALVRQKLPWILRRQNFAREHYLPSAPKTFTAGEKFLYLGKEYELLIVPGTYGALSFNGKGFFLREGCVSLARWIFRDWYREQAAVFMNERVRYYANRIGARYSEIAISNAQRRWGSCSSKGVLNFSWRLMMAPPEVVDYVVVHEVVHLEILNHSQAFWHQVKALAPDYLKAKHWLERHHLLLHNNL